MDICPFTNNYVGDENDMADAREQSGDPNTTGIVIHRAFLYDLFVWLASLGRERAYREQALDLARLKPCEAELDTGCGTGALPIASKPRPGPGPQRLSR